MISYLNPVPSLPEPFGPHKVGTSEWEIPVSEIASSAPSTDSTISTIKFRLYYPTLPTETSGSIKWLPPPQSQWIEAYSSFLGAGARLASFISALPSLIKYTTIPAIPDAPLLPRTASSKYPLVVFSHGLGGNFNTYSSVCAALASFGIVCAAPEHRDGSAPISLIRSSSGQHTSSIPYQKHSHSPTPDVLNARNAQLRIRLWEMELLSTVLLSLNTGKTFTNYAASPSQREPLPSLSQTLDLQPGHITWAGHSFGAATTVQFVKSVYYHEHLPSLVGTGYEDNRDWRPLYTPAKNSELVEQITPDSPVALLDLWTMPLRGDVTQWLWEKPLPCYDRRPSSEKDNTNVVAVISTEFHKWTELLSRTKAALSNRPAEAIKEFDRAKSDCSASSDDERSTMSTPPGKAPLPFPDEETPPSSTTSSTEPSRTSSPSPASTPPPTTAEPTAPALYLIPDSAHLSQSDFGLLFPNLTRYLMKAHDPQKTIELNVRAILAVMRGRGLEVENFQPASESTSGKSKSKSKSQQQPPPETEKAALDSILSEEGVEARFVRLPLS
ncbi:uncharacterized protein A1O9_07132 [Exophiala aquamarina CBS 119918]|uniref:Putative phospholipase n=1 Tax=Exophiala aquamarina CBS 119918 TaxID=1182545 RepID=A0A072PB03_9EURO|nr:uncharacterized protein A1O9_07132 [Exophiala aquamarina CBS 119918]KEF56942.1 hypothetical protein A1O9_07132 [Exophiala aquamarina CBS 119918]